ncbi:MFS transporter [Bacillus carboniphilus]|uniref:MFS transporter n=1 Tax=Bacillus carboniphilus TaxID=86663 RepID=A0ABY9JX35_9BACI|nr:MFS transporter [Bacillus carboniphilus]WLR43954.1 MFS transporter [Bacillus carboniphilus]
MFNMNKILGEIEVNRDLILLLLVGGLYSLSVSLSNTFVNVYLWKQSGRYIDLAVYNLSIVIMQMITFILAGLWAKKVDRVIVLRLGVIFLAIFFITVLIIGDKADQFLLLLGALLGVGYGFYWLAFNVLTFEITEPETRDFFNGFLGILTSVAGMFGPIVAGLIISNLENFTGYTVIFTISLIMFTGAVVLSFFIDRRPSEGQYILWRIVKERKRNRNWRRITYAHIFQGLREGTFIFVISVFVFISTGSELALGKFGLLNSAVAFVTYYGATRLITKKMRKKAILLGGIILYASIFLILFNVTYPRLLLYAVCIAIGYPILLVPYSSMTYDVIGRGWNAAGARIEYIVVREIFLNIGRIISIGIFMVGIMTFSPETILPYILLLLGLGHPVIYFFIRNIKLKDSNVLIEHDRNRQIAKPSLVDGEGS